jgi:archaeal flagellar protein FlaI
VPIRTRNSHGLCDKYICHKRSPVVRTARIQRIDPVPQSIHYYIDHLPNYNSGKPDIFGGNGTIVQISDFLKSIQKSGSAEEPEEGPKEPLVQESTTGAADDKTPATPPAVPPIPAPVPGPAPVPVLPVTSLAAPGKKTSAGFGHYLHLLKGQASSVVEEYDFERHGTLVNAIIPENYDQLDQYWVEKGRSLIIIAHNAKTNQKEYLLYEPSLSDFEYELLERLHEDLRDVLILTTEEIRKDRKRLLLEKMYKLLDDYGLTLEPTTMFKLQYFLVRNFIGWSRIDPLMKDPMLEDISCDGNNIPIFLYHRQYRNIKTNIAFEAEVLNSLAITLAQRSGKHISTGSPMIDATLPEGSRLQLTLGTEVTTRGTSFTIRKFREEPFSPIELMETNTFSPDALAYFWLAIENNKSLLFIGGTASGKTTSLNAVSLFIPPVAKVVSIEDTREITLYHDNWIASVTREALTEGGNAINMFDLLRAAMRQRPEFILVGEVRGVEAQTLFQAMNTGHTTFSTMHAGSVDAAIHRLESEPLNVPRNMMQALNVISVQGLIYRGTERVRRVQEIVEIAGIDPSTGNLRVNNVFIYDPIHDKFSYTGRSQVYADIAEKRGWTREQLETEIGLRKSILVAMQKQDIKDYISVASLFHAYNINARNVLANVADLRKVIQ